MNNSVTISILGQNGGEAQGEPPDGAMAAIRRNGDGFEPHAIGSFVFAADDEGFMTDVSFMLSAFLSEEARTGVLMALMALELGFENEEESE
jgi:hypothetical protein